MIDLCEVLDVVFDDDFVVTFVDGKVVDEVEEKIENAGSGNVLRFIDERVSGYFDPNVVDAVPKIPATTAENDVAIRIPEPVTSHAIDAVGD